jgi:hypothetical protein
MFLACFPELLKSRQAACGLVHPFLRQALAANASGLPVIPFLFRPAGRYHLVSIAWRSGTIWYVVLDLVHPLRIGLAVLRFDRVRADTAKSDRIARRG